MPLHYKKDGSLDMRYSSSRAAVPSVYESSVASPRSMPHVSTLNCKKDGTLDMRYASSKAAVASGFANTNTASNVVTSSSQDLHFKKDGTPDMRYKSSKLAAQSMNDSGYGSPAKKETSLSSAFQHLNITGIPKHVPLTKSGLPDMRTKAAKEWVASCSSESALEWLPKKKDGTLDSSKAVVKAYLDGGERNCNQVEGDYCLREQYYQKRMEEEWYRKMLEDVKQERIECPQHVLLKGTDQIREDFTSATKVCENRGISSPNLPDNIPEISYSEIEKAIPDNKESCVIGRGGFGVVLKVNWRGKTVAVKCLHVSQLTKKELPMFERELNVMARLGSHPNLVTLYGYCIQPPCLIMEFVELGSLNHLLHYSTDANIEVKLSLGATKKRLAMGIASGMAQLHAVHIVHGDLKPHNVLVTSDYTAKITDFGLATLRGKTSSTLVASGGEDQAIGGTASYMAPELLNSSKPPQLSSDVYSFGVVLNEMIQEEEPYAGEGANFHGRGQFGAANYALLGNRPKIHSHKTPTQLKELICKCWDKTPEHRPTFTEVINSLKHPGLAFKDSFQ